MALRLSRENLRAACARLRAFLASGDSDHEACTKLNIGWADYEELRTKMLEFEVDRVRKRSPDQVYVEYCMQQENNIHALSTMIDTFHESKQYGAMVGAVKARAEIYDKIIEKGQEFGIIDKRPDRQEIIHGILIRDLTDQDLQHHIFTAVQNLAGMIDKYGQAVTILDVEAGPVYPELPAGPMQPMVEEEVVSDQE